MTGPGLFLDRTTDILFSKYQEEGKLEDLQEVIQQSDDIVGTLPNGRDKCTLFAALCTFRDSLAMRTGRRQDFEDAISTGQDALSGIETFEKKTKRWWDVHAQVATTRYNRDTRFPDLKQFKETEGFQREFSREKDKEDPMMPDKKMIVRTYGLLGAIIMSRYERLGSPYPEEIEDALDWSYYGFREIKALSFPEDDPDYADFYYYYSMVLFAHFRSRGISHSLNDALAFSHMALDVNTKYTRGTDNNRLRAFLLSSRGAILEAGYQHYKRTDSIKAHQLLDEAIKCGPEAQELLKPDDHNRVSLQIMTALWYCSMMERTENLHWGEMAIQFLEEALKLTTESISDVSSAKSRILQTQAQLLTKDDGETAASKTELLSKLDEAMLEVNKAIENSETTDRRLGLWRENLAALQILKFSNTGRMDKELTLQAKHNYATAASMENAVLSVRLSAALQSGILHLADEEIDAANNVFQKANTLLSEVHTHVMSSQDAQEALRRSSELAEYAVSVDLLVAKSRQAQNFQVDTSQVVKPQVRALRTLESSRCLISGESIRLKVDLTALKSEDSRLASRYEHSRRELTKATKNLGNSEDYYFSRKVQMTSFLELAALEEEIRELDAFKNFQQVLTEKDMKALASEGPIIAINVSRYRSDAIIVTTEDIILVELRNMKYEDLHRKMADLDALNDGSRRDLASRVPSQQVNGKEAASSALLWLWEIAVKPILESTPLTSTKRVWWITSGIIGRAPLHAAGDHKPGSTNNTISQVKSSYISSFKALRHTRERNARAAANHESHSLSHSKMLLVTVSKNPPGHRDLDTSAEEAAIQAIFAPSGNRDDVSRLSHLDPPIPKYILMLLPKHTFVHFACHGKSVGYDPSQSGLLLLDANKEAEMLTVMDLEMVIGFDLASGSMTAAQNAGLVAYLSACSTAEIGPDEQLTSEAINLGNSFQSLGFRHVIATLFGANDAAAGEIAKSFYTELVNGESKYRNIDVAEALHHATLSYRNAHAGTKDELNWIPFIHIGA